MSFPTIAAMAVLIGSLALLLSAPLLVAQIPHHGEARGHFWKGVFWSAIGGIIFSGLYLLAQADWTWV